MTNTRYQKTVGTIGTLMISSKELYPTINKEKEETYSDNS